MLTVLHLCELDPTPRFFCRWEEGAKEGEKNGWETKLGYSLGQQQVRNKSLNETLVLGTLQGKASRPVHLWF